MNVERFRAPLNVVKGLLVVVLLLGLTACGDDEGDIASPSITPNAANAYFTTSATHTLWVDTEAGSEIEVFVAEGLTADPPVLEGSSAGVDTWSFVVSGLVPGGNAVAVTARDVIGNQRTLYLTVTYDFLAIDRLYSPVEVGTTAYEVMGTVADATLPTVTVTASDETPISPVVVTLDATYSKRWIATFDLPAVADTLTLSANRNDGTDDVTKTFAILAHDSSVNPYPVATINLNDFEITETGSYPDSPLNDTLSLSGTCQADATVNLLFNNQEAITDAPCVAGIWNHDVTLSPGKNFITLTVTDDSLAVPLTTTAYDAVWYLLP